MVYRTVIVFVVLLQLCETKVDVSFCYHCLAHIRYYRELTQQRRRRWRKGLFKKWIYLTLFQNSSLLFHVSRYVQCWWIFLDLNLQDCKKLVQSSRQNVKLGSFTSRSCKKSEKCPKNLSLFCLSRCRRLCRRGLRSVFKIIDTTLRLTTSPAF